MTAHRIATAAAVQAHPHRFRLSRAGILNIWQYDDQVFEFAGGRLLLRGANGAGKSKTLEMLLPFVLDGDKLRMTASGRHHTSLLWLMTDGYDGTSRIGYLWVEFVRTTDTGADEWVTCGIGIRASQSARTATTWYFTSPRRVGHDLRLEDGTGPLPRERCRDEVAEDGHFFDSPRQYKQHVGETLFGLAAGATTNCSGCCTGCASRRWERTSSQAASRKFCPSRCPSWTTRRSGWQGEPWTSWRPSVSSSRGGGRRPQR
jgi:hypothetical protein